MASRRKKKGPRPQVPAPAARPPAPAPRLDVITLITLAALVGALLISFAGWQKIGFIEKSLGDRLERIEVQAARAVASGNRATAQPPQPARRGPDPEAVYEIKTAGSPVRGAPNAPVTIAEFSDFQ
jgi:protein-disulfide isomerase